MTQHLPKSWQNSWEVHVTLKEFYSFKNCGSKIFNASILSSALNFYVDLYAKCHINSAMSLRGQSLDVAFIIVANTNTNIRHPHWVVVCDWIK